MGRQQHGYILGQDLVHLIDYLKINTSLALFFFVCNEITEKYVYFQREITDHVLYTVRLYEVK